MQPHLLAKKIGYIWANFIGWAKKGEIWAKSKSCISKNILSHTAMTRTVEETRNILRSYILNKIKKANILSGNTTQRML